MTSATFSHVKSCRICLRLIIISHVRELPFNEKVAEVIHDLIKIGNLPDTALNFVVDNPRCSVFYMLPKIHESGNPGHPIVSTCSCPTENISEYLDSILQVLVQDLPTYVKDTVIRIGRLNFSSSPNIITMDVKKLYTEIQQNDGLKALKHFMIKGQYNLPLHAPSYTWQNWYSR